jgi:peptidoglycan/xylan/chitin deacetylase (PgdA/CDA1 family)
VNKPAVKRTFYQLLSVLGIYQIGRFVHRRQALILTYHGIVRNGRNLYTNRNCVEMAMFDRQMAYMARHYKVVPLSELVGRLNEGKQLPRYTAAITFDDGFRNNLTVALPILQKYHLPATIFLATSFISSDELGLWTERVDSLIHRTPVPNIRLTLDGVEKSFPLRTSADREIASDQVRAFLKTLPPAQRKSALQELDKQLEEKADRRPSGGDNGSESAEVDAQSTAEKEERYAFLSWQQVQMMAHGSITIGSHTHSHAILAPLSESDLNFELTESQRLIEQNLGVFCTLFSYPNGAERDFGRREEGLLGSLGYVAAVSQIDGFNDASTNIMALRRINIPRDESLSYFKAKVSGIWSVLKRLQNGFRPNLGARRGMVSQKPDGTSPENRTV